MALARQIPDSTWRHLWKTVLTHTVTVRPVGGIDDRGQRTLGTAKIGVACFISKTTRRFLDAQNNLIQAQWQVLFAGPADIDSDYLLTAGLDRDGMVLLDSAKVINVDDSADPIQGKLMRTASCIPQ